MPRPAGLFAPAPVSVPRRFDPWIPDTACRRSLVYSFDDGVRLLRFARFQHGLHDTLHADQPEHRGQRYLRTFPGIAWIEPLVAGVPAARFSATADDDGGDGHRHRHVRVGARSAHGGRAPAEPDDHALRGEHEAGAP